MSDSLWVLIPTGQRRSGEWIDDTLKQRVAEAAMFSRTPLVADFPRQRVEVVRGADADAAVGELFRKRGWTDGLPIVPPTVGRVEAMLRFTDLARNQVVGELDPLRGAATVEKIAANAVMAGCRPEYLPLVLAVVEALVEPDFNLRGVQTTDENVTPLVIINGPVARDLDINARFGALGPGWQANATIGRTVRLIMNNIGGGWPGVVSFAGLGQPGRYSLCFAEDEASNPWESLSVEAGFVRDASTVTVMRAESAINVTGGLAEIASAMGSAASNFGRLHDGNVAVILAPAVAKELAADGWKKAAVKHYLAEKAVMPAAVWRDCWVARNIAETTRLPDWVIDAAQAGRDIPAVSGPERITLVVAGGDIPIAQHAYFPSWGFPPCRITKEIRLPPDWDNLRLTTATTP